MAWGVSLDSDRTLLPLSLCFQPARVSADQVGHLRYMCGSYNRNRVNSANFYLPFVWASWLVLSACDWTCLYLRWAHRPALHWPCHFALPFVGYRHPHQSHAGVRLVDG